MTFTKETKTIVIGGTSGIGKAVATALANRDGTIEVASRSTGLDVKDEAAIAAYFDAQGPVDHVVFTAGSSAPGGAITNVFSDCGFVKRVSGLSVRGHGSLRGRRISASWWCSVADRLQCRLRGEQASLHPNRLYEIDLPPSRWDFASRLLSGGNSDQAAASFVH